MSSANASLTENPEIPIDYKVLAEWSHDFHHHDTDEITSYLKSLIKVRIRSLSDDDLKSLAALLSSVCARASINSQWLQQYQSEAACLFAGLDIAVQQGLRVDEGRMESALQSLLTVAVLAVCAPPRSASADMRCGHFRFLQVLELLRRDGAPRQLTTAVVELLRSVISSPFCTSPRSCAAAALALLPLLQLEDGGAEAPLVRAAPAQRGAWLRGCGCRRRRRLRTGSGRRRARRRRSLRRRSGTSTVPAARGAKWLTDATGRQ